MGPTDQTTSLRKPACRALGRPPPRRLTRAGGAARRDGRVARARVGTASRIAPTPGLQGLRVLRVGSVPHSATPVDCSPPHRGERTSSGRLGRVAAGDPRPADGEGRWSRAPSGASSPRRLELHLPPLSLTRREASR